MKINAITTANLSRKFNVSAPQNVVTNPVNTDTINTIQNAGYQDWNVNINFKQRSPENFYEYNMERLPKTMKEYLEADYSERSKIAPVQIMNEAYDDLSVASTVEDIKELYPDEPLFQKLHNANYGNASSNGILKSIAQVKKMQETPEPLFKDGSDDLTTYIVKKIFLEGKTVKEIDKDFEHDINSVYELAARKYRENVEDVNPKESIYFTNSTTRSLGIRFPEVPFWNSLIATREDYARTNRVKVNGKFENADKVNSAKNDSQTATTPKEPKHKFTKSDAGRLATRIANSHGNVGKTINTTPKTEELTFLQKYWGEIMSVVAEKIHLSEELIIFNEKLKSKNNKQQLEQKVVDDLIENKSGNSTNKEREMLKIFWDSNNKLKEDFSQAITDTIMLFKDADEEGSNEFNQLLDYAHSIKPYREAERLRNAILQEQYDELGQRLIEEEKAKVLAESKPEPVNVPKIEEEQPAVIPDFELNPSNVTDQYFEDKVSDYEIKGVKVRVPFDVQDAVARMFISEFKLAPKQYTFAYLKDMCELLGEDANRFFISVVTMEELNCPQELKSVLYSTNEIGEFLTNLRNHYKNKTYNNVDASRIAMLGYLIDNFNPTTDEMIKILHYMPEHLASNITERVNNDSKVISSAVDEIQKNYDKYDKKMSKHDQISVKLKLFDYVKNLVNYDEISQGNKKGFYNIDLNYDITAPAQDPETAGYCMMFAVAMSLGLQNDISKKCKNLIMSSNLLDSYGNIANMLSDKNASEALKHHGYAYMFHRIVQTNKKKIAEILVKDNELMSKFMSVAPETVKSIRALARK